MKKTKLLGLITLPLVVGGAGVLFASNMTNNNEEVIFQKELKEIKSVVNNGFIKDLSLGTNSTGIIITDAIGQDHLYTWGDNSNGQLGLGYKSDFEWFPQEVTLQDDSWKIKNIETNGYSSAVVVTDSLGYDYVYMTGLNDKGQLGNGTQSESSVFTKVSLPQSIVVKDLSLGEKHSTAIATDTLGIDHIYSWGYNSDGQLGNGSAYGYSNNLSKTPIDFSSQFGSYSSIKEIESNFRTSGAIVTDNQGNDKVYIWGNNSYSQIGNNSTYDKNKPVLLNLSNNYTRFSNLSLGWYHSGVVATDSNGNDNLYTWGSNGNGQLGLSNNSGRIGTPTKVTSIPSNQEFIDLSFGSNHSSAVTIDENGEEHAYIWGSNSSGELGNGSYNGYNFPIEISSSENSKYDFELGYYTSSVIVTDSYGQTNFYLWGDNQQGQLGNGSLNNVLTPTPGGDNIDKVSLSTTFIEQVSSEEFIFEISSPAASDLSENVAVYNSNGVKVGDTTLTVNEKASKATDVVYTYNVVVTDFDNASSSELYWSVNNGETLNLISENRFEFSEPNNTNVVIYSSIGIGLVILIILIIVFVVLFLTKDNDKEESQEDNWDQQKSKKQGKNKKAREEDQRNRQNDVLDAF